MCIQVTAAQRSTHFLRGHITDFIPDTNLIRSLVIARGRCTSVEFLLKEKGGSIQSSSSEAIVV